MCGRMGWAFLAGEAVGKGLGMVRAWGHGAGDGTGDLAGTGHFMGAGVPVRQVPVCSVGGGMVDTLGRMGRAAVVVWGPGWCSRDHA